mmetsp:Transcript_1725/g.6648  ORF Transcript_1725/g.6648 Transcript_1725/m.6648 type:complete len:163 (+) Transcript_1725:117-605(+)
MFCLDYALSFAAFYHLTAAAEARGLDARGNPVSAVLAGAASGLAAAVALWPVDLVRQTALGDATSGPRRASFAISSVPFGAAYLGVFFGFRRDDAPLAEVAALAAGSTALALAIEFPFDHAKHALVGGGGASAAALAAIRLPLSALLLLAFDAAVNPPKRRR